MAKKLVKKEVKTKIIKPVIKTMTLNKKVIFTILILLLLVFIVFLVNYGITITGEAKAAKPECNDRKDNDLDGRVDMNDLGCNSRTDNDETNCADGKCEGGESSSTCPQDCGYPNSCSDTDGGNVANVFGTVSGYYNNAAYGNNDSCISEDIVNEYYCSGSLKQSVQQSCGTDIYSSNYCSGSKIYKDFVDYYCSNGVCSSITTPQFVQDCSYGCSNGICNSAPSNNTCTDTDGGSNINTTGTVSGYFNNQYYSDNDYCISNNVLIEYYCSPNGKRSTTYGCGGDNTTTNCVNGACVSTAPIFTNSCTDTDEDIHYLTQGTVYGYLNGQYYSNTDYCINNMTIMEYWCGGFYDRESRNQNSTCEIGCQDGACLPRVCGDGVCNGLETCASCPADCKECSLLCGNGTCDVGEDCSLCVADCGTCVGVDCTDSDWGYMPKVKGVVRDKYGYSWTDQCSPYGYVTEYVCFFDGQAFSYNIECKNNCSDGACV